MAERAKQHNQLDREIELAGAERPEPPADFKKRWDRRHFAVYDDYLTGRAWADWHPPQLRLMCQAVDLEIGIQEAYAAMNANGGPVALGSAGQPVQHPSPAVIAKLSNAQGGLLRRLGIAVDGTVAPRDVKKNALKASDLQAKDETPTGHLLA